MYKKKIFLVIVALFFISVTFSTLFGSLFIVNNINNSFKAAYTSVISEVSKSNNNSLDVFDTLLFSSEVSGYNFYSAFSDDGLSYAWLKQPVNTSDANSANMFVKGYDGGGRYSSDVIELYSGGYLLVVGDKGDFFEQVKPVVLGAIVASLSFLLIFLIIVILYTNNILKPISYISNLTSTSVSTDVISPKGMDHEFREIIDNYKLVLAKSEAALASEVKAREHLKRFVSTASHELRTPLTVIVGYSELLKGSLNDERDEWVSAILKESKRLTYLINNMLTSIESGIIKVDNETYIDIKSFLEDRVFEFMRIQPQRDVHLDLTPCRLLGNTESIYRVVDNILSNIIKYTDKSSDVSVLMNCSEGVCRIVFEDRGGGAYADADLNIGSNGLGMGIIRESLVDFGGTVDYVTNEHGGLSVVVDLPCKREDHLAL